MLAHVLPPKPIGHGFVTAGVMDVTHVKSDDWNLALKVIIPKKNSCLLRGVGVC